MSMPLIKKDIHGKWLVKIGEAVQDQQTELAQQMSQITDQVVPFVLACQELLQGPSASFNGSIYGPSLTKDLNTENGGNGGNIGKASLTSFSTSVATNSEETLQIQLKNSFGFAHIIQGNDSSVNQDRLLIVCGRGWKSDFELNVTRAIITTNSRIARDAICKAQIPQLKAICILPNPDWIANNDVDVVNNFISIVKHIRSTLPTVHIILSTMPIESGTDFDSAFAQFNSRLVNTFTDRFYTVIKTSDILPKQHSSQVFGQKRHILPPESSVAVITDLAKKLTSLTLLKNH